MSVEELIKELEQMPQGANVWFYSKFGWSEVYDVTFNKRDGTVEIYSE